MPRAGGPEDGQDVTRDGEPGSSDARLPVEPVARVERMDRVEPVDHVEPNDHLERVEPADPAAHGNGLPAASFVALADVASEVGDQLLSALSRARIPAYLAPRPGRSTPPAGPPADSRLFVARSERADARTVVLAALRGLGADTALADPADDPLAGLDTDLAFRELIADWHVDTVIAVREAERDLSREDADWRARLIPAADDDAEDWLADDHYVPPAPPPLPRFSAPTVLALVITVLAILVLALGGELGLPYNLAMLLGIGGVLVAAGIMLTRLRQHHEEDEGDGSVV